MSNTKAWTVTLSAIFTAVVIAITQNKIIPCISLLANVFDVSASTAGWFSSVFCVTGIVTAFPAATCIDRFGVKKACVFSASCAAVGSLIGALSHSAGVFLISRVIEGVGAGVISVAVPTIIAGVFPPQKRGLPSGIWTSWQSTSQVVCFFCITPGIAAVGWRNVWYIGLVLAICAAVLSLCIVDIPGQDVSPRATESPRQTHSIHAALQERPMWLVSFAMFCFCFVSVGFVTWIAECWVQTMGMKINLANQYVGILAIVAIPFIISAGKLMDMVNRHRFAIAAYTGFALVSAGSFLLPGTKVLPIFIIAYSIFDSAASSALWAIIPQTVREKDNIPIAVAVFILSSNLGMLIGPPLVGFTAELFGWKAVSVLFAAVIVPGTVAMFRTKDCT